MDKDLIVMNDGSPTLFKNPNSTVSAVDLAITGSQLAINSQWSVLQDCGNSNHYPTLLEINSKTHFKFNLDILGTHHIRNFKEKSIPEAITIKLMDRSLDMENKNLLKIMKCLWTQYLLNYVALIKKLTMT